MKKFSFCGMLVAVLIFIGAPVLSRGMVIESQWGITNREKSCEQGFTVACPPSDFYKWYQGRNINCSTWTGTISGYGVDTNGNRRLDVKDELTINANADLACDTVTNASGSATLTHTS